MPIDLDATLKQIQQMHAEALETQNEFAAAAQEARDAAKKLQDVAAKYVRVYDRLQTYLCDALTEASENFAATHPSMAPRLKGLIADLQRLVASRVRIENIVNLNNKSDNRVA
jgi:hypothetical protein